MRRIQLLFVAFLIILSLNYGIFTDNIAFADDFYEENYDQHGEDHEEDSALEEIGELIGWGAAIMMVVAGLLFPIRRSAKMILTNFPNKKTLFISISKLLGKNHVFIGVTALVFSIAHGISMYVSEGELESEGFTGIASVLLMVIAGVIGMFLMKNKKAKSARTTHTILLVFALVIAAFHIFNS